MAIPLLANQDLTPMLNSSSCWRNEKCVLVVFNEETYNVNSFVYNYQLLVLQPESRGSTGGQGTMAL